MRMSCSHRCTTVCPSFWKRKTMTDGSSLVIRLVHPIDLLRAFPAEQMTAWKVDRKVGNVRFTLCTITSVVGIKHYE